MRWKEVRYPVTGQDSPARRVDLRPERSLEPRSQQVLPANTPSTQPYWLREEPTAGMFRVSDPSLIGRPENPPAFPIENVFEVGGQTLVIQDELVQAGEVPKGQTRRGLEVIAPVALSFVSDVQLFAPNSQRPVTVEIAALRPASSGKVKLDLPAGWSAAPSEQPFALANTGEREKLTFNVTAPAAPVVASHVGTCGNRRRAFRHKTHRDSLQPFAAAALQPRVRLKAVTLDLATRGRQIGYVPGAGDSVAENLEQMGYEVTRLSGADLTPERLRGLDAVVIGIRAFNSRTDLEAQMPALFKFVEDGGNVIVQYNRPEGLKVTKLAPYDLKLSQERVCEEKAPVTILAPDHPALNSPNKITAADFDGWVQERGLYFPKEWDSHFTPLLACSDTDEPPKAGGLLVAQQGKGYFVYTALAWFRQLPAGVPGSYRLFANLVSLGK